jgi:hypothetical protein
MNIQVKKRNSDSEISRERSIAGWSKWPTRQAHDLKTAGSNPAPALHVVSRQTKIIGRKSYEYKRESHEHTGMERMKKLFSSTPQGIFCSRLINSFPFLMCFILPCLMAFH